MQRPALQVGQRVARQHARSHFRYDRLRGSEHDFGAGLATGRRFALGAQPDRSCEEIRVLRQRHRFTVVLSNEEEGRLSRVN